MDKYYKKDFLNLLQGKTFASEDEMEKYLESILPSVLNIAPSKVYSQKNATPFSGKHSKRPDIVIEDENDQIIVVLELKLQRSIANNYSKSSAIRQMQEYCQSVGAIYGVLLSEKYCKIFKYFPESRTFREEPALPPINQIKTGISVDLDNVKAETKEKFTRDIDYASSQKIRAYENELKMKNVKAESILREDRERHTKTLKMYTFGALLIVVLFFVGLNYFSSKNSCNIKGNISASGEKIYHTKESTSYADIIIDTAKGEKMFCSEKEAVEAGFKTWGKPQEAAGQTATTATKQCDDVKGNISQSSGEKIYHTKDSPFYKDTQIDERYGEKMFCTEQEAINAGFKKWQGN